MSEKLVCIKCGQEVVKDKHDEFWCDDCVIDNAVSADEKKRWDNIKGTVQLYLGTEHVKPCAVFVRHLNKHGMIVADELNTGTLLCPKLDLLVEYDHDWCNRLRKQAHIVECEKTLKRLKEEGSK
jgi:hypothetical protein